MSRYFLLRACWDAISKLLGDNGVPRCFRSDSERAAAYSALVATLARYKFISAFVSAEDPGLHSGARFIWLTVRPADDIDFEDLQSKIASFTVKDSVVRAFWCFEQSSSGVDEQGEFQEAYGFHCHYLFEFQNSSGSMARTLGNHFRPWNVKFFVTPERFIHDKINYMLGNKDDDKMEKVAFDAMWREDIGLAPYFSVGSWPIPDDTERDPTEADADVALDVNPTERGLDEVTL